jgi:hypothetical protein
MGTTVKCRHLYKAVVIDFASACFHVNKFMKAEVESLPMHRASSAPRLIGVGSISSGGSSRGTTWTICPTQKLPA